MKFAVMNCPECGEPARGSIETLSGVAVFTDPAPDGSVDYEGTTDLWWDEQKTIRDAQGRAQLICHNGHDWFTEVVHAEGLALSIDAGSDPASAPKAIYSLYSDDDGVVLYETREDAETAKAEWEEAGANNVRGPYEHFIQRGE